MNQAKKKKNKLSYYLISFFLVLSLLTGCQSNSPIMKQDSSTMNQENNSLPLQVTPSQETPSSTDNNTLQAENVPLEDEPEPTPMIVEEEKQEVSLLAVGDNLIHIEVVKSGEQSDGSYDFSHLYSNLAEEISAADIAVINQETILGGNIFSYSGYPNFYSPVEIGEAVIDAGFDVVLHATNHTLDKGVKGLEQTFQFWNQHPEILVLGINQTPEARKEIPIYEKNGIKIAMLNYTYGLNGYQLPEDKPYLVNLLDRSKMKEDIQKAKEISDFVIVFPHWGSEYVYKPTSEQQSLVDFFYDLEVDLVIGAHPHVIEPVEWIQKDSDHKMLVYYSLGNFLSYQKEAPRMLGAMANVTITKDETGTYINDASITPIMTHYEHGPSNYNYGLYKLNDYSDALAQVHGVSDIAKQGSLSYENMIRLAKDVLGNWYQE